jgi:hypothetical protein
MDLNKYIREPAVRVFAGEFNTSKLLKKYSDDEKAPSYLITPTGAVANRVLISGVLVEKIEKEDLHGSKWYKLKINDNTGMFTVTIGTYQPDAIREIAEIAAPEFVVVIGKPSVFENENGSIFTSLKAENIIVCDPDTRNIWTMDTAQQTLARILVMEELQNGATIKKIDPRIREAVDYYKGDMKRYDEFVKKAVGNLALHT